MKALIKLVLSVFLTSLSLNASDERIENTLLGTWDVTAKIEHDEEGGGVRPEIPYPAVLTFGKTTEGKWSVLMIDSVGRTWICETVVFPSEGREILFLSTRGRPPASGIFVSIQRAHLDAEKLIGITVAESVGMHWIARKRSGE